MKSTLFLSDSGAYRWLEFNNSLIIKFCTLELRFHTIDACWFTAVIWFFRNGSKNLLRFNASRIYTHTHTNKYTAKQNSIWNSRDTDHRDNNCTKHECFPPWARNLNCNRVVFHVSCNFPIKIHKNYFAYVSTYSELTFLNCLKITVHTLP